MMGKTALEGTFLHNQKKKKKKDHMILVPSLRLTIKTKSEYEAKNYLFLALSS